mmetsp:Transcript_47871/g.153406  ORF Transcript_47871/g.153406 Transcript_47871/m.153406 type:complete len:248 (+) Transcript_47871:213-956(+)
MVKKDMVPWLDRRKFALSTAGCLRFQTSWLLLPVVVSVVGGSASRMFCSAWGRCPRYPGRRWRLYWSRAERSMAVLAFSRVECPSDCVRASSLRMLAAMKPLYPGMWLVALVVPRLKGAVVAMRVMSASVRAALPRGSLPYVPKSVWYVVVPSNLGKAQRCSTFCRGGSSNSWTWNVPGRGWPAACRPPTRGSFTTIPVYSLSYTRPPLAPAPPPRATAYWQTVALSPADLPCAEAAVAPLCWTSAW